MSSYITPQGIAAEKKQNEAIADLMPQMLKFISGGVDGVPISDLHERFADQDEVVIRSAMWNLLDDNAILLRVDRRLERAPVGHDGHWY